MTWSPVAWPFTKVHPVNGMVAPAPVQAAALEFGADLPMVGYWLEQGLAKTATDLAHFTYDLQCDRVDAHCVIAPSYLKSGWEDEAALWSMPMPVITWPDRVPARLIAKPHVFVINYEALLQSGGKYLRELLETARYSMTADECSALKNFGGITSRTVRDIGQACTIRRGLSGTPMTQNVMDLYAQLRWIGLLNGVNPYAFRNRFAVMGGYMGKQVKGIRNEEELHRIMDQRVFRALKRDWWTGQPAKLYMRREFEMTKRQKDAYSTMLQEFYTEITSGDIILANQVMHAKQKLQQISRGFIIDKDNERVVELVAPKDNPAVKAVIQAIEETPGKLLIGTFHNYSTDMLINALRDYGVAYLRGGMTKEEIAEQKLRFNHMKEIRVMVGQKSVAARGHTLIGTHGDRCSNELFFENDYNLETRLQFEDRIHRFGQDEDCGYTDLFCCSEDKAVVMALQAKTDMVEAVVNAVRRYPKL